MTTAPVDPSTFWPLFELTIATDRLDLRPVADGDLDELAALAEHGIHAFEETPFPNLWTDRSGQEFEQAFAQYFWSQRARWSSASWTLAFTVRSAGVVVGVQQIEATDFATLRTVSTSSWLGRDFQGLGLGTEMRGTVLAFAFEALGAELAVSTALEYNPASIRVSEKLGYTDNGIRLENVRGKPVETRLFRLTRERWEHDRPIEIRVEGLEPCLELLGHASLREVSEPVAAR